MRSPTTVPFLLRGALVALLVFVTFGAVLSGPAVFGPGEQSAEAALLSEVKKLTASDAQALDWFGYSVAVSGGTAVVGAPFEDAGGVPSNNVGHADVTRAGQGHADVTRAGHAYASDRPPRRR